MARSASRDPFAPMPRPARATPAQFWAMVVRAPDSWAEQDAVYSEILAGAAGADAEMLRLALNWLEMALVVGSRHAATAAARLVEAMPESVLAGEAGRLAYIFNSRKVGMAWRVTPGEAPKNVPALPPKIPLFGGEAGFGLVRSVPELYRKLAMLSPDMEEMVRMVVEEAVAQGLSLPADLAAMAPAPSSSASG